MARQDPISLPDLAEMLKTLERRRFYGAVEIKFEAGHVTIVRKTENFKTPEDIDYRLGRGEKDGRD